eukprot:1149553-Pelagomonas_calceolata.AAC.8
MSDRQPLAQGWCRGPRGGAQTHAPFFWVPNGCSPFWSQIDAARCSLTQPQAWTLCLLCARTWPCAHIKCSLFGDTATGLHASLAQCANLPCAHF